MLENAYQARVIKELHRLFPGCVVLKNDANYMQGIPDLVMFMGRFWAMLEVKVEWKFEPNQEYYVDLMNGMSFAAFIHPENEAEVYRDLQQAYESYRACFS